MHDYRVIMDTPRKRTRRGVKLARWFAASSIVVASSVYFLFDAAPLSDADAPTLVAETPPVDDSVESRPSLTTHTLLLPGQATDIATPADNTETAVELPAAKVQIQTSAADLKIDLDTTLMDTVATTNNANVETSAVVSAAKAPPAEPEVPIRWHNHTIKNGESLAIILNKMGIGSSEIHHLVHADKATKRLTKIQPGESLRVLASDDGEIHKLLHDIDRLNSLEVTRTDDSFSTRKIKRDAELHTTHATAIIENSLFLSGQKAGLSDAIIMELAAIFGWDIDFALDIRSGDSFTVAYEERYLDGDKLGDGAIISAEFVNRGRSIKAVRYTDPTGDTGYYSPDGRSMRKAFLRTPVDFTRISSRFSLGRKHPILNRIRAHKGVDYAASHGTPVRATGDGKVVHRGRKGGYGKTIIVQHGGRYETLYAHLSNYSGKAHQGNRIKQGQIIGYVGQTGLATGPHLHYEFHVDGVHRNPLTVKLPEAQPISEKFKADFLSKTQALLAQLDLFRATIVAER
jgi:murein DD-endopeptidase MepM/ murein hydrolase activator NlpD